MTSSVVALTLMFAVVAVASFVGFYSGRHHQMNLEQWTVGGRQFGLLLVWLLMAGEVYTTFSFLGASGWAYSRGGPTLYIIAYLTLTYVVSFYILPLVWELGRKHGLQTQPDFFRQRYGNKYLAALVALIGVACIVPYLQLQLTGLGIIMEVASSGGISPPVAMLISFALVAAFVSASGIRAVAWVSVMKDVMMVLAVLFIGIAIPYIYFGGIGQMFAALAQAKPTHLVMPGATKVLGHGWYVSTVLLCSFGGYMWPHSFGAAYSAKSSNTLRRNAVLMPLYTLMLPLVFMAGFAAILVVPNLQNGDLSLITVVSKTFPAWVLGLVGAAGALTAMVPSAIILLTAATLFAKNFYRPVISPGMSDDQVAKFAKILVVVITGIALYFAIYSSSTLVALLLIGYDGVSQFLPGVLFGLFWKRVTMTGVFAGIVLGEVVAGVLVLGGNDPFFGMNAGFVAVCLNFVVTVGVSMLTPVHASGFDDVVPEAMAQ